MPIPAHEPVAARAAVAVLDSALERLQGRVLLRHDQSVGAGLDPLRWTTVPFAKVVLSGRVAIAAADAEPAETLAVGDGCLFAAGSQVNDHFPGPCSFLRITCETDLLLVGEETVEAGRRSQRPHRFRAHVCHRSLGGVGLAALERLAAGRLPPERRRDLLRVLLGDVRDRLVEDGPVGDRAARLRREIHQYLQEHCTEPIDRGSVARVFGISRGHLSRLFGLSGAGAFRDVLIRLRLQRARHLLRQADMPIAAIAERCGFSSANYFAQAFRAAEGCAPSQWRRRDL
ncbi:MAG: helix-turn-helix transcriptional regulator [Planctomycetota bacterium]